MSWSLRDPIGEEVSVEPPERIETKQALQLWESVSGRTHRSRWTMVEAMSLTDRQIPRVCALRQPVIVSFAPEQWENGRCAVTVTSTCSRRRDDFNAEVIPSTTVAGTFGFLQIGRVANANLPCLPDADRLALIFP